MQMHCEKEERIYFPAEQLFPVQDIQKEYLPGEIGEIASQFKTRNIHA
jgi:hypothetical protein